MVDGMIAVAITLRGWIIVIGMIIFILLGILDICNMECSGHKLTI
jgi:hypothetical protein